MEDRTIAHWRPWKIWAVLALTASIAASIPILTLVGFATEDGSGRYHFAERFMIVSAWFLLIPIIREIVGISTQLIVHRGRMIWIENGQIVWKYPSSFTVPCNDVAQVVNGFGEKYFQADTIVFRLRDGSEKVIAAGGLNEPCNEVVHRLREALGITAVDGPALVRI